MDCLHDEADEQGKTFNEVLHAFQSKGCAALTVYGKVDGSHFQEIGGSFRAAAMGAMFDLLGDDVDGAAAMMEDAEYMGMFD
jgi:hypothetical protein